MSKILGYLDYTSVPGCIMKAYRKNVLRVIQIYIIP